MNLAGFFKRSPTLAEMRATLTKLDVELQAAHQKKQQLHDESEAVYLEGTEAAASKHREALAEADRALDMLDVQRRGVARRIDAAATKERHDELRRRVDAGRAASDEALDLLIGTYIKQAEALAGTLRRLQEQGEVIADGNRALEDGVNSGVFEAQRTIPCPYTRAYQPQPGMDMLHAPVPVPATVHLPDPRNGGPWVDSRPHIWPPMEPIADQGMSAMAKSFGGTIPWTPVDDRGKQEPVGVDHRAASA